MKQSVFTGVILAIMALSCTNPLERQDNRFGEPGTDIEFGAASGYHNGEETRTIYSGQLYGTSPKYERIDWVAEEDDMTIFYNKQSGTEGTYVVTGVEGNSDENSWAHIQATSGKLRWVSGTGHVFYAMYPKNGTNNRLTSSGGVTGTIPDVQNIAYNSSKGKYLPDMDYGYMVAYANDSDIAQGRVDLRFTPAMTAFEFRLQRLTSSTNAAVKLTKVELISASNPLIGTFSFNITGGDNRGATWNKTVGSSGTTITNPGTTITVNFPTGGVSLPAHGATDAQGNPVYLDFTVFALPVSLSGLTVRLSFNDDSKLAIPLNDSGTATHTFAPCKKHIITNTDVPDQEWTYVLGDLEDINEDYRGGENALNSDFVSYRYKTIGQTQRREKVAFTLEYYNETTGQWSTTPPTWLAKTSGDLTGSTTGTDLKLNVTAQTNTVETETHAIDGVQYTFVLDDHTKRLRGISPYTAPTPHGTASDSRYNLATYNVATGQTITGTSANCYVVNAPGNYSIPMVYGNALNSDYPYSGMTSTVKGYYNEGYIIDESSFNPIYWNPDNHDIGHYKWLKDATSYDTNYTQYLFDHTNHSIDRANPHYSAGSTAYRETFPYIITHLENPNIDEWRAALLWTDSPGLVTSVSLSGGWETCTLVFTVPAANICQGNAVVAALCDGKIAWSWHIWVTDEDLTQTKNTFQKPSFEPSSQSHYSYAPVNIGWRDGKVEEDYAYRSCQVRAIQQGGPGIVKTATVTQEGTRVSVRGDSPYYQYGRKDPLPASQVCKVTETETAAGVSASEEWVSKPVYPGTTYTFTSYSASTASYDTGILNPHTLYKVVPSKANLWNSAAYSRYDVSGMNAKNEFVHKSVYDPSPVGYKLGPQAAFNGFTTSNFTWSDATATTPAGRTYNNDLFFPAIGYLNNTDRALTGYGSIYYRSANPTYSLYFTNTTVNTSQTGFGTAHAGPLRPILQYTGYPF